MEAGRIQSASDAVPGPESWRDRLAGSRWTRQTIGQSGAGVFRLRLPDGQSAFLKSEDAGPFSELPDEIARLRWLAGRDMPAPLVLDNVTEDGRHWLLMTAVPGEDLASSLYLSPEGIVIIAVDALRALHRLPVALCPYDHRLDQRLRHAGARAAAGLVDQTDFDEERLGRTADDLFAELLALRPPSEDVVVTHGDACLPNLIAGNGRFAGFVDCGRLGVADRHQDLALAARSIETNLGAQWVAPFFACYGFDPDPAKIRFYQLLDEFF